MSAPRIISLKGRTAFDEVFRRSRKFTQPLLSIIVRYAQSSPELSELRLGIMVRKKLVNTAVRRNRIRRVIREIVREIVRDGIVDVEATDTLIIMWNTQCSDNSSVPHRSAIRSALIQALQQSSTFRRSRLGH